MNRDDIDWGAIAEWLGDGHMSACDAMARGIGIAVWDEHVVGLRQNRVILDDDQLAARIKRKCVSLGYVVSERFWTDGLVAVAAYNHDGRMPPEWLEGDYHHKSEIEGLLKIAAAFIEVAARKAA